MRSSFLFLGAILKFTQGRACFKLLKSRLPPETVKSLDKVLTIRCQLTRNEETLKFYVRCINQGLIPKVLLQKLLRDKLRQSPKVCEQYIRLEMQNLSERINVQRRFLSLKKSLIYSLDIFLLCKYFKYCRSTIEKVKARSLHASDFQLKKAVPWSTGYYPCPLDKHITNLSSYDLSTTEKQALCRGLQFSVPRAVSQPVVDAEFENLFSQLSRLEPREESLPKLKADLVSISRDFSKKRPFASPLSHDHLQALKALRKNPNLVICPPDKGNSVIILNKSDYVRKTAAILSDTSKFTRDEFQIDLTSKIEKQVIISTNKLKKLGIIDETVAKTISPKGSIVPRLYGLPKIHKQGIPVRPILSMAGTPTHKLAQWLSSILKPVRDAVSDNTVQDSFEFRSKVLSANSQDFFCSFDITSLFTNVPLLETIGYIETIVDHFHLSLPVDFSFLKSLILLCTQNIQFSFDGVLYFQKDGVAMGSPLGPVLADIFVGFLETFKAPTCSVKPSFFCRYVDDSFACFPNQSDADIYLNALNSVHPCLKFTCEFETNAALPFLDVLVHKSKDAIHTSVYRKPTWTGLYTHFLSFVPEKFKRNLIHNLFDRARRLCSPSFLDQELQLLKKTFEANGYPTAFITRHSSPRPSRETFFGPEKMPAFLRVPFVGDALSRTLIRRIRSTVGATFTTAEPRILFMTSSVGGLPPKDPILPSNTSNCIYKFSCGCGSSYVGRTERRLGVRMAEHLPKWSLEQGARRPRSSAEPSSAITRHVTNCQLFQRSAADRCFSVVARARHARMFPFLEATLIASSNPDLCRQKDFVLTLKLPW